MTDLALYEQTDQGLAAIADSMERALLLESGPAQVKTMYDQVATLRRYADITRANEELRRHLAVILLRAARHGGKLIADIGAPGRRSDLTSSPDDEVAVALKDIPIHPQLAQNWRLIAGIPDELFEARLQHNLERAHELTVMEFVRYAKGLLTAQEDDPDADLRATYRLIIKTFQNDLVEAALQNDLDTLEDLAHAMIDEMLELRRADAIAENEA